MTTNTPKRHKKGSSHTMTTANMTMSNNNRNNNTRSNSNTMIQESSSIKRVFYTLCFLSILFVIIIIKYMSFLNTMQESNTNTNTNQKAATKVTTTTTSTTTQQAHPWSPFNTTNPHKSTWCPDATCQNSPLCTPCNRRHLIILSTARSGSTSLLSLLNHLPNVRIAGENHHTFGLFASMTDNLKSHQPNLLKHPMDKPDGPFRHNTIPQGSFGCIAQQLHYMMNPPPLDVQQQQQDQQLYNLNIYDKDRILGYKSVRTHKFQTPRKAVKFYKSHFPCSKFIINIQSNISHQYESYVRTFDGDQKKDKKDREMKVEMEMEKEKKKKRLEEEKLEGKEQENKQRLMKEEQKETKEMDMEMESEEDIETEEDNYYEDIETEEEQLDNYYEDDIETEIEQPQQQQLKYNGPSKKELREIRNFHVQLSKHFGPSYSKLIRFDEWKSDDNIYILNDVLEWLGYVDCTFSTVTHDNENGYSVDNSTVIDLGSNCHYPFLKE